MLLSDFTYVHLGSLWLAGSCFFHSALYRCCVVLCTHVVVNALRQVGLKCSVFSIVVHHEIGHASGYPISATPRAGSLSQRLGLLPSKFWPRIRL